MPFLKVFIGPKWALYQISGWLYRNRVGGGMLFTGLLIALVLTEYGQSIWLCRRYPVASTVATALGFGFVYISMVIRWNFPRRTIWLALGNTPKAPADIHLHSPKNGKFNKDDLLEDLETATHLLDRCKVKSVLLSSPLLAKYALRMALVQRLNKKFASSGSTWKAIDSGLEKPRLLTVCYKKIYPKSPHSPDVWGQVVLSSPS